MDIPEDQSLRALACSALASDLTSLFETKGNHGLLEEIVDLNRACLLLQPVGNPGHAPATRSLAISLYMFYAHNSDSGLIIEAICLQREVLNLLGDQPDEYIALAGFLSVLYERTKDLSGLDESICVGCRALDMLPPGNLDRLVPCTNLAVSLKHHAAATGDDAVLTLNKAIKLEREALALQPAGRPGRDRACENLAISLHRLHALTRDDTALDNSMTLLSEAVRLRPVGHPFRASKCEQLAASQMTHALDRNDKVLFGESVRLPKEAISLQPAASDALLCSYKTLAALLFSWYNTTQDASVLDEALSLARQSSTLASAGNSEHTESWRVLVAVLKSIGSRTMDHSMLEDSTRLFKDVLSLKPPGHPEHADACKGYISALLVLHNKPKNLPGPNKFVELQRIAAESYSVDHPERAVSYTLYTLLFGCHPGHARPCLSDGPMVPCNQHVPSHRWEQVQATLLPAECSLRGWRGPLSDRNEPPGTRREWLIELYNWGR